MAQMKNYITLQVILLFTWNLLSADDKTQKVVQNDAIIPHIVSGPGKILDISKKSLLSNEENKDINDLLYKVYRKFHNDLRSHVSDRESIQHKKKGVIVETDAITYPQKKPVDELSTKSEVVKKTLNIDHGKPVMHERSANKEVKEEHQIALRDLERTIDKLIESLTKVSEDGKFEENEISKGIEDMSKFAVSSHINIPAEDDDHISAKNNEEIESFGDFRERFYKTFMNTDKRQNLVYHGKKDVVTPRIVYHGKDSSAAKHYRDSSNNIKASKWLTWEGIKKQRDFDISYKKNSIVSTNNIEKHDRQHRAQHHLQNDHIEVIAKKHANMLSGERMKELAYLYEELKKQTAAETKRTNIKKSFKRAKRRNKEQERDVKIERLKKDLVSLFDVISNNGVNSGGNRMESSHHGDNTGYTVEKNQNDVYQRHDEFNSNLSANKITSDAYITEDQNQIKRRLLSMVRSLEAQLSKQDSGVLPKPSIQSEKGVSNKINDRFETELDSIASGIIESNNKYATNSFVDAINGFTLQSEDSEKKSKQ